MFIRIIALLLMALLVGCFDSDDDTPLFMPAPLPNQAPQISELEDQIIDSGTSSDALAITISDDTTAADNLMLTASGDNPDLLNESSFSFGGSGENRTLTVTPIEDITGMATITLMLDDTDGGSSETSFLLTVEQATVSLSGFVRDLFASDLNAEPIPVDGLVFEQDAGNDDFADLLQ